LPSSRLFGWFSILLGKPEKNSNTFLISFGFGLMFIGSFLYGKTAMETQVTL
jgi:hypothetical protein